MKAMFYGLNVMAGIVLSRAMPVAGAVPAVPEIGNRIRLRPGWDFSAPESWFCERGVGSNVSPCSKRTARVRISLWKHC